ncbi:MAG TPA: sugar-binding domain-containing protein, partial [Chloroflexota bacterium]
MAESAETLHPTPQHARTRWVDLCGSWGFAHDDRNQGLDQGWPGRHDVFDRQITVPFPPESPASGIGDTGYHPVAWYRRAFSAACRKPHERLLLHCGAIDYRAQVWVNGHLVATHEGGQTPFCADITNALVPGDEQELVIRAEDQPLDLAQPRGKQDWLEEPHAIWYHRTTGIWQPVWLEAVNPTHMTNLRWTPSLDPGLLTLELTLRRETDRPLRARVRLSIHGRLLVDDTYSVEGFQVSRGVALTPAGTGLEPDRLLWSPAHPNLIEATISILDGDEVLDEVHSYAGLRSVGTGNGRFSLNGQPFFLRMALHQGYWPESHLAAPSAEALRREVELARELGLNGLRIHQKVEDPRFLYWCDRLGLIVWGEMANAFTFTRDAVTRLTREWLAVVERDYSHPCIVAWVPLNESWGVPNIRQDAAQRHFLQSLYHLTKTLDPTRPVIGNDGWEQMETDIFGIHDYSFSGQTLTNRYASPEALAITLAHVQPGRRVLSLTGEVPEGTPFMLTEFGGISYRPQADESWFGYGTVGDAPTYLAKYKELVEAVLACAPIAGFCYTQLTDTRQETNGLLTENREHKLDPATIQAITQGPAASLAGDVIVSM